MLTLLHAARTRLLPALLTAAGVTVLAGGIMAYGDPRLAGTVVPTASPSATPEPTPRPRPSLPTLPPPSTPTPRPSPTEEPASPTPTAPPSVGVATRVVIPRLDVDLPVIAANDGYPLCNVAMYFDDLPAPVRDLGHPGRGRAVYLFAHARDGMFGPIYEQAIVKGRPQRLKGLLVEVYTADDRVWLYEVTEVRLHQTDLDDALDATSDELWLQTSEGPRGTKGKTQLRAVPLSVEDAEPGEAHPRPRPIACD